MAQQDTSQLKEKIVSLIKMHGPSLPVRIARETGQSMLFASAFLSELLSEKKIKISNMRVGSSPIYLVPGQEAKLENYALQHLKSKEKEAFILLRDRKFLKDSEQEPAIRVALRAIKDFAIPLKKDEEIYWRYLTADESQLAPKVEVKKTEPIKEEIKREINSEEPVMEKSIDIFDKKEPKENVSKKEKPKPKKKAFASQKSNEKFFNSVKETLTARGYEILDITSFNKSELTLKIQKENKEILAIAFNKTRATDSDLIKAAKKAQEHNLSYLVLAKNTPTKKISELIEAIKALENIEKIE